MTSVPPVVDFDGGGTLICPISMCPMVDPVFTADGHTYDRASIEEWFATGSRTSPVTGLELTHLDLVPNYALRSMTGALRSVTGALRSVTGVSDLVAPALPATRRSAAASSSSSASASSSPRAVTAAARGSAVPDRVADATVIAALDTKEFDPGSMPSACVAMIVGGRGVGKSVLLRDLLWWHRSVPMGVVMSIYSRR